MIEIEVKDWQWLFQEENSFEKYLGGGINNTSQPKFDVKEYGVQERGIIEDDFWVLALMLWVNGSNFRSILFLFLLCHSVFLLDKCKHTHPLIFFYHDLILTFTRYNLLEYIKYSVTHLGRISSNSKMCHIIKE